MRSSPLRTNTEQSTQLLVNETQCLLTWSLIYKHNFPPNSYIIWHKNKSIYFDNCLVSYLMTKENLLNMSNLCHTIKSQLQQRYCFGAVFLLGLLGL